MIIINMVMIMNVMMKIISNNEKMKILMKWKW